MITMGKPMGNGIPISGLAAKEDVLAAFSDKLLTLTHLAVILYQ